MSKVISAEVPDELADGIDATRAGDPPDYDESRSAAVKRLIRRGLDADENSGTTGPAYIAQLLGWVLFAAAFVDVPPEIGYLGAAIVLATVIDHRLSLTDRLT
jgi:hypothetical protein